ncbi:hypothetical protein ACXZ7L_08920 [Vibrio campbellii]|nr:hypothetical protein [Vibrio campbellii]
MYKEVAFDPSCMGSMEYYGLVKQHFGHDHGRYISADVKAWAREAIQHVKASNLQPVKQKSIKNYLNKLVMSKDYKEFHLAADRKVVGKDRWNDWYEEQIAIRPFSFAISEAKNIDSITIDDINEGDEVWLLNRSVSVERSAKDILEVLVPLIKVSNSITIIDQFFRFSGNETLKELLLNCTSSEVANICVVSSIEPKDEARIYDREYKSLNSRNIAFQWIKAPDKFFHDRYFITDVGAVRSGHGFMPEVKKGTHADKANLNIISREEVQRTLGDLQGLLEVNQAKTVFYEWHP